MDIVTAHGIIASLEKQQRMKLPCRVTYDGEDVFPATATALALHSGWLEDCQTPAELAAAVEHGCSLLTAGVITPSDMRHTTGRVIAEVVAWGEQQAGGPDAVRTDVGGQLDNHGGRDDRANGGRP